MHFSAAFLELNPSFFDSCSSGTGCTLYYWSIVCGISGTRCDKWHVDCAEDCRPSLQLRSYPPANAINLNYEFSFNTVLGCLQTVHSV